MKRIILITIVLNAIACSLSYGQTVNQFHSWWTYSGNHSISEKTSIQTLYSMRRHDFVENWQQSLLRLGVNYKVSKNLTVTPGYDWVVTFPYGEQPIAQRTTEHRLTLQAVVKNPLGAVALSHRYRFEQRYIESINNTLSRQRLRYRFILDIPLSKALATSQNGWFLTFFNEVFVNVGNDVGNHIFDQDWTYLGLGYKIDSSSNIKLGYMNQYVVKSNNSSRESNHTLMISVSKNFSL